MEVLTQFSKLYNSTDNQMIMQRKFLAANQISAEYGITITTCSAGWALIEGDLSEADATTIEAKLDAIFMDS